MSDKTKSVESAIGRDGYIQRAKAEREGKAKQPVLPKRKRRRRARGQGK